MYFRLCLKNAIVCKHNDKLKKPWNMYILLLHFLPEFSIGLCVCVCVENFLAAAEETSVDNRTETGKKRKKKKQQ